MQLIRTSAGALCAILFVVSALAALLLFNFERRAFDPTTYKRALAELRIYEQVPELVGEILAASASYDACAANPIACQAESRSPEAVACFEQALGAEEYASIVHEGQRPTERQVQQAQGCIAQFPPVPGERGGPPPFLASLTVEEWRQLITALLPPVELQALADQTFDSVFAVINGSADSAAVDLTGLKQRLAGPAGVEAVLTLLHAQPPCTLDQIAAMTLAALNLQGDLELCSPTDELALVMQPLIEVNLQLAALGIPDQATILPPTMDLSGDATPLQATRAVRLGMRLSPLLPLLFLLALSLFVVRSLGAWLRWWGWPFLIVGIGGALIGWVSAPVLSVTLAALLSRRLPPYLPVSVVELAGQLTEAVVRQMLSPVLWQGLALAAAAVIMLVYARHTDRQARRAASEAATEIIHDDPASTV